MVYCLSNARFHAVVTARVTVLALQLREFAMYTGGRTCTDLCGFPFPFIPSGKPKEQRQGGNFSSLAEASHETIAQALSFQQTGAVGTEGPGTTLLGAGRFVKGPMLMNKKILGKRGRRDCAARWRAQRKAVMSYLIHTCMAEQGRDARGLSLKEIRLIMQLLSLALREFAWP